MGADRLRSWQPWLEPVVLCAGDVLLDFDPEPHYLYFPQSALIALQQRQWDGHVVDTGLVGLEGVVGAHLVFGTDVAVARAVVLAPGAAQRMPVAEFRQCLESDSELLHATLQYLQNLARQMAVTALCLRHHTPLHHLCRRTLEVMDRLPGEASFAQELLLQGAAATHLRPAREALQQLCAQGAVQLQRGRVSVVQRAAITRHACGCYSDALAPVAPACARA